MPKEKGIKNEYELQYLGISKHCPFLNRQCIQEECVAFEWRLLSEKSKETVLVGQCTALKKKEE